MRFRKGKVSAYVHIVAQELSQDGTGFTPFHAGHDLSLQSDCKFDSWPSDGGNRKRSVMGAGVGGWGRAVHQD